MAQPPRPVRRGARRRHERSPDGERYHGWWQVRSIEPPAHLEFEDGFSDAQGRPTAQMPTTACRVCVHAGPDGGTRMMVESSFASAQEMAQLASMGMQEGMTLALGQMDAILQEETARA